MIHIAFTFLYSAFLDIANFSFVKCYQLSPSSLHMSSWNCGVVVLSWKLRDLGVATGICGVLVKALDLSEPVSSSVSQCKISLSLSLKVLVFYENKMLFIFLKKI